MRIVWQTVQLLLTDFEVSKQDVIEAVEQVPRTLKS
jgi:hypothetical protein